jgi:hypothetical protein
MIKAIKSIGTSMSPLIKDSDIVLYEENLLSFPSSLKVGKKSSLPPPSRGK